MNGDLEKWLNEGLAESMANAEAEAAKPPPALNYPAQDPMVPHTPVNPVQPPAPGANGELTADKPKQPPSLSKYGIGRGGIIRNPNTKRRSQLNNPVTNPRPSKKNAYVPTEESDARAELIGQAPSLAMPSVLTGMDVNTEKPSPEPETVVQQVKAGPISYDMTLRQLLQKAASEGGNMRLGNDAPGTQHWTLAIHVSAVSG